MPHPDSVFGDDQPIVVNIPPNLTPNTPASSGSATNAKPKKAKVLSQPAATLAADVEALAASLNVEPTDTPEGPAYRPDSFVRAVQAIHDKLAQAREALVRRQAELDKREQAVAAREAAVQAREQTVAGLDALAPLFAAYGPPRAPEPAPKRGILAWLR
jgi:hypothetical protein